MAIRKFEASLFSKRLEHGLKSVRWSLRKQVFPALL